MVTKVVPGQLVASEDASTVARDAASRMAKLLRTAIARPGGTGRASLALSGGNTPRDAYARLAREEGIEWGKVDVFWVDERAVAPTDDRSNYRWAKATLLDGAHVPTDRVHRMPADAADRDVAAREYEATVRSKLAVDADGVPAFDVIVLGVGDDGHTASLFPGEPTVNEHERLVIAVPAKGSREARMTLSARAIEHARNVLVLAVGAAKRPALERVWSAQGDVLETPARVIRGCRGAVVWIIDRAAGGVAG
jgi:6-phosphogluconolactonase